MKKLLSLSLFLSLSLVVLFFAGCNSPTGGGETQNGSTNPLVGTWQKSYTSTSNNITTTMITQYTFNADGTLLVLNGNDQLSYTGAKGTYSVDAEGNVTVTATAMVTSATLDPKGFKVSDLPSLMTYKIQVLPYEGKLFINEPTSASMSFLIAQGPVSGIVGTWAGETMGYGMDDSGNMVQMYYKAEAIFSNDGNITANNYTSTNGTSYQLTGSPLTAGYTYSNDTLTIIIDQATSQTYKVAIYNNKVIQGNGTSVTANAYIKQ